MINNKTILNNVSDYFGWIMSVYGKSLMLDRANQEEKLRAIMNGYISALKDSYVITDDLYRCLYSIINLERFNNINYALNKLISQY